VVPEDDLDDAVDRALALRLVSVLAISAELDRLSTKGRNGVGNLKAALRRRGLIENPLSSVLESRFRRLLRAAGIEIIGLEVVAGPEGQYRLDTLLSPTLAVEVDGYSYHASPEQMAYDARRRNELRISGMFLLVYTWSDIVYDGARVIREIHEALALQPTSVPAAPNQPAAPTP
jgi:very-short-patch-repair endonuclease